MPAFSATRGERKVPKTVALLIKLRFTAFNILQNYICK